MKYFLVIISLFVVVGCSGDQKPESPPETNGEESETSESSISFGILDVVTKGDVVHVTGEARTTEESFYYILEYGESLVVEETEVALNDEEGDWRTFSFEVSIKDKGLTEEETPFLTLYVKDGEKVVNPNYIPVDLMIY